MTPLSEGKAAMARACPEALSPQSAELWGALLREYRFEWHELAALFHALRWQDVSNALLEEAATMAEPHKLKQLKAAGDAATVSQRYWKSVKFTEASTRRPGRPSGDEWSAQRKMQRLK